MKYKVLLTGENKSAIDDFFLQMQASFLMLATSGRKVDILNHFEVFEPDIFVYCLNGESAKKDYNKIYMLKEEMKKRGIALAVLGSEDECKKFERVFTKTVDLMLVKPLMSSMIESKISYFLKKKQKEEERIRQEEERIRQEEERIRQEEERIQQEEERIQQEEERIQQEEAEESEEAKKLEEKQQSQERKHILVIDDDPVMLKMVNAQLREKYNVATAISGNMALKFLKNKHTDLILLDYEMPVDNGPAVLKKLREDPATQDIPVVFLTGITEKSKIQEVLVLKPQGYLLKPIEREKLFKVISDVLSKA